RQTRRPPVSAEPAPSSVTLGSASVETRAVPQVRDIATSLPAVGVPATPIKCLTRARGAVLGVFPGVIVASNVPPIVKMHTSLATINLGVLEVKVVATVYAGIWSATIRTAAPVPTSARCPPMQEIQSVSAESAASPATLASPSAETSAVP